MINRFFTSDVAPIWLLIIAILVLVISGYLDANSRSTYTDKCKQAGGYAPHNERICFKVERIEIK